MGAKRPNLKRPGITMTGRQGQTVDALRRDGWLILEVDPLYWTDGETARVRTLLARRDAAVEADPHTAAALSRIAR